MERKIRFVGRIEKIFIIITVQDDHVSDEIVSYVTQISEKYDCVVAVDKLSNLHADGCLEVSRAALYSGDSSKLAPDVVISLAGNTVINYRSRLKNARMEFEHWIVNEEGRVADPFKRLTTIFECSTAEFYAE